MELIDEEIMRSYSRLHRRALRELCGKCASCAWPANTICTRNCCPQGIAYAAPLYHGLMAELERTCHTPEDWRAAADNLLRQAETAVSQMKDDAT